MRADDDKVHASRLLNLKETLTTIREGGAARLKADKDAAAVGCKAFLLLRFPDSHPSSIVRARSLSVAFGSGSKFAMPRCILGPISYLPLEELSSANEQSHVRSCALFYEILLT